MTTTPSARQLLLGMFEEMVVKKDSGALTRYFHPDFLLETNGQTQNYQAFLDGHRRIYATPMTYAVRYDDDAWVEGDNRVAARVWVTTQRPGETAVEFEIMLVATCRDGRLYRLWKLTRPDWTQEKSFENYG